MQSSTNSIDYNYLIVSVVMPLAVSFAISISVRPIFQARYLIFTLPALSLCVSALIDSATPAVRRLVTIITLGLFVIFLVILSSNLNTPTKEDYATVASRLMVVANPQDIIIVSAPFTIYPLEYYYQGPTAVATLPRWNQYVSGPIPAFNESKLPQEVLETTANHQRAWLLLSYDQGYEKKIRDYFDNHYERLAMYNISPGMTFSLYKLRYDTQSSEYQPQ